MEIPGNTWLEVWETALPVPAKWQKRLFNDTIEAEKILDYLERKTPNEFIELLLPVLTVCVIQKLLEESADEELPGVDETLSKLIKKAERLGRMPKIVAESYKVRLGQFNHLFFVLIKLWTSKATIVKSFI